MTDTSLFANTACWYSRYRHGYDAKLYEEIMGKSGLDGDSVVLDIGTGTGTIAHTLSPKVKRVYALDPSREMLDEARRITEEKGLSGIIFIEDVAEHIDRYPELIGINLVTLGASLHWIQDIDTMLGKVAAALKHSGWLSIQFGALVRIWTENPDYGWRYGVTRILQKYLGEERRAGDGFFKDKTSRRGATFEEQLMASGFFGYLTRIEVSHTETWTQEKVLGFLYSTSFARRSLFGNQVDAFEEDVRAYFDEHGMTEWKEMETHVALMAQRTN